MTIRMSPSSPLVVEARAWADELEGLQFDGAPVAEVGLIRRLADALEDAEKVRRLHSIATQRTVDLAAVIEKAKAEAREWQESPLGEFAPTRAVGSLFAGILSSADTAAVLAEHDAEVAAKAVEGAAEWLGRQNSGDEWITGEDIGRLEDYARQLREGTLAREEVDRG